MPKKVRDRFWYWGPPIAWAAGIFLLSSLPIKPQDPGYPLEDKVIHALLFWTLALLFFRALAIGRSMSLPKAAFLAFLFTTLYGVVDELHQSFTPLRTVDVWDWVADLVGAALVFPAAGLMRRAGVVTNDREGRRENNREAP